ncbi:MAG: HAD-IIB family hydrolase [Desulfobacterales bacterium]|nr:HAD-IIB family hydrolase [Desulfobacterales bacterium]
MKPFDQFPQKIRGQIRFVLTDIDDTLTLEGRLVPAAFAAMERLQSAGHRVVPITGRPAGWCDHIARMWPVDAVVGENGAFYFSYDRREKKMRRVFWKSDAERSQDRRKLDRIQSRILETVPGCRVSADQAYREADLAIDFREDVPPLPMAAVDEIVRCFTEAGAQAKISSIHVNGWFGGYDKLSMTRRLFEGVFSETLDQVRDQAVFCGDSPNDAPLFAYFPHAVGVANVRRFMDRLVSPPAWVTQHEGGEGFAEMVDGLLGIEDGKD